MIVMSNSRVSEDSTVDTVEQMLLDKESDRLAAVSLWKQTSWR